MMTKKLLLVEDDSRMRSLLSHYFRGEGFDIREAENGQVALEIFEEEEIDLVILDIMLPIIDGWQVCSIIRKSSQNIPIILLTARDMEEDKLFGFELGADDYVTPSPSHLRS
ncbi:MAG TPA: response regulator [Syntrophomonadaceae bacterium]|nr:response regulator [Syntrophomonadaceae bacterium]